MSEAGALATMTQQELDELERKLIAALYAIWRAQGKRKKVVKLNGKLTRERC